MPPVNRCQHLLLLRTASSIALTIRGRIAGPHPCRTLDVVSWNGSEKKGTETAVGNPEPHLTELPLTFHIWDRSDRCASNDSRAGLDSCTNWREDVGPETLLGCQLTDERSSARTSGRCFFSPLLVWYLQSTATTTLWGRKPPQRPRWSPDGLASALLQADIITGRLQGSAMNWHVLAALCEQPHLGRWEKRSSSPQTKTWTKTPVRKARFNWDSAVCSKTCRWPSVSKAFPIFWANWPYKKK